MKTYFPLLFLCFFLACSDSEDPIEEIDLRQETIIPGTGITSIAFGDSAQKVFDTFGDVTPRSSNFNSGFRYFLDYSDGVTFVIEEGETEELNTNLDVIGIIFESPYEGVTAEGIGIGSLKSEVIVAFGEPDSDIAVMKYDGLGLVIGISNDVVDAIQIEAF